MKFVPPKYHAKAYTCPHCNVFANQNWWYMLEYSNKGNGPEVWHDKLLWKNQCDHCDKRSIWYNEKLIQPDTSSAPMPHVDLPADCLDDFHEARSIISRSPRGAAALLRLIIQKLMPHLGEKGKNIDEDIASLVKKGLAIEVQQALDACRVIGNNAVHPGAIDLTDSPEMAIQMCELINFIVDNRISQPKKIQSLYAKLPAKNLAAIQTRDNKTP